MDEELHWDDAGAGHRVNVLDAATTDGGAFQARLPFEVVRRYVDARGAGRLPDQLLAALELRCAYCVGVGLPALAPDAVPCAFCRGARVWRLPWRGHASSDGTIQVPSDLAECTGLRGSTLVRICIWDKLPTAEVVVIEAVPEANNLLPECTSTHLTHQVGIVYLNMKFPLWRNKEKFGEFVVIGELPIATAILTKTTRVYVRQGGKDTEMGVNLHHPIFHPIVQNLPKSEIVGSASMSRLITLQRNLKRPIRGKCSVVLYGPYQKEAIARGVACALNMSFESTSALHLIKDYPDDSVAAVEIPGRTRYSFTDQGCIVLWTREEQEGWDNAGAILRGLMTLPYNADNNRWSTPNVVLYGWNSSQMCKVASSFAAGRSLNLVRVEASKLLMQYNHLGAVAISDLFLRATCERPALLFIDRFDTVGDHPLVNEFCLKLDNLDRHVHVCVAVRWWQLMNPRLLQPGRLDKHVFCHSAALKLSWDAVGEHLIQLQRSRG